MPGALSALGAVVAVAIVGTGGAVAGTGEDTAVIKAKANFEEKRLYFTGPKTVERGAKLEIRSTTDPQQIGPHSFSLVKQHELPETKQEMKACFRDGICGQIARWHEIEFPKNQNEEPTIGKRKVAAGKKGWDRLGSSKRKGDSIFLDEKGESFKQKVSGNKGKTLFFICAIHPEMQGKIKIKG